MFWVVKVSLNPTECPVCVEHFGDCSGTWIQCNKCEERYDVECAEELPDDYVTFAVSNNYLGVNLIYYNYCLLLIGQLMFPPCQVVILHISVEDHSPERVINATITFVYPVTLAIPLQ